MFSTIRARVSPHAGALPIPPPTCVGRTVAGASTDLAFRTNIRTRSITLGTMSELRGTAGVTGVMGDVLGPGWVGSTLGTVDASIYSRSRSWPRNSSICSFNSL